MSYNKPMETVSIKGRCVVEIRDADTGKLKSRDVINNLYVTTGKEQIAQALAGNVANNVGQITYCAVGTGVAVPVIGDTGLQTELYRKQVSVRSVAGRTAQFQTFFNRNEANGSLQEAGLFGAAATAIANSGTLFCRLNINRTKSSNDTLTLRWGITVN